MELHNLISQKHIIQLPNIEDKYNPDRRSETWNLSRLKKSEKPLSKSPIQREFFLRNEPTPSPEVLSISPIKRQKIDFAKIKEKKLQEFDVELDKQELKYSDLSILKNVEFLFYSYTNYLEGVTQCILSTSHIYKSSLSRAKNGFISIFRKIFSRFKQSSSDQEEKYSQTVMSINPQYNSLILSKLGDIIDHEILGIEKLEKYIQKNFIVNKRKSKVSNLGTQTEYKTGENGVIEYSFRSYDEIEKELEKVKSVNQFLVEEKKLLESQRFSDNTDKLLHRNKVLESMIIQMRHSAAYQVEDIEGFEDFS